MRTRTYTVFEVLHDRGDSSGPAGDGTHVARFRTMRDAERFAKDHTCYGRPATVVRVEDVPLRLAQRWGIA